MVTPRAGCTLRPPLATPLVSGFTKANIINKQYDRAIVTILNSHLFKCFSSFKFTF